MRQATTQQSEPAPAPTEPNIPFQRRTWVLLCAAFAFYGLISLLAYRPILPGESSHIPTCACGDPALQTWFLRWVPFAIAHGHNPLFSNWTNYPYGVNLAQNTEMPLLGLLTAPLTVLVSPIASYTLLLWLAFPASATAMFFVVKRWTGSTSASIIGGFLYGFSAYVVGQSVGHVMLSFVPLPPLFFYQLHKLATRQGGHPYREGLVLGAIGVAQFFIEEELLATFALVGLCGLVFAALGNRRAITRDSLLYLVRGLASASALTILFVSYSLWFIALGPQHYTGTVVPAVNPYHSSLLGPLITTRSQYFAPGFLFKYGKKLGYVENGIYIGLPVLLLVILVVVRFRRNRWLLLSGAMAFAIFVLSLGSRLTLVTRRTSIPLPFALIAHIPVINNMIPSRLSLYVAFFVALTVALGIADLSQLVRTRPAVRRGAHAPRRRAGMSTLLGVVVLSVLSAISLVPKWPYYAKTSNVPSFFTTSALRKIPVGSVVLTYPFPYYPENQAMMWQAAANMRFKEMGTYALIRNANGRVTTLPPLLAPAAVQEFLVAQEIPQAHQSAVDAPISEALVNDLRDYLERYQIDAVVDGVSDPTVKGNPAVISLFVDALGPPQLIGGVALWANVPSLLRARS